MLFPNNKPVVISGSHGGGTSFIAKALRYRGLFIGNDVEPFTARKYHESNAFRVQNETYLKAFGDSLGFSDATIYDFERVLRIPGYLEKISQDADLKKISEEYWGNEPKREPWGWKDPRNSLTAPIWKVLFPNALFVIIQKKTDNDRSRSSSGEWFRRGATNYARTRYMLPDWLVEWDTAKSFSFESLVNDHEYFNTLLDFCGMEQISSEEFYELLINCNFEGKNDKPA